VVVEGDRTPAPSDLAASTAEARELVAAGMRPRDAAKATSSRHGVGANDIYRALLEEDGA
jgi:hypothetical protein